MAETNDGIDLMRSRMARAQRVPPSARRPATTPPAPPTAGETRSETERPATPPADATAATRPARRAASATVPASRRPRVGASDPPVNLAIRVRRPLDEHLVDVLHDLRKAGVRSSKVELVEMLLWELPGDAAAVRARLGEFRRAAPRASDGV